MTIDLLPSRFEPHPPNRKFNPSEASTVTDIQENSGSARADRSPKNRMRILFLTQVLPYPLDAGPKIRAYYVLRHLVESGHDVTLVSFVRAEDGPEHLSHLSRLCTAVHTVRMQRSTARDAAMLLSALVLGKPFLIVRDRVPAMLEKVRSVVRTSAPFDAIHADQLWMAPYALFARDQAVRPTPPLVVLDQHNAVFQIPERLAESERNVVKRRLLRMEARKLSRFEREVCERIDRVVWVTAEDQEALNRTQGRGHGSDRSDPVIPIALEASRTPAAESSSRSIDPYRITFMGGLHWPPNLQGVRWFADEIWPRVRAQLPDAILTVIGKNPTPELFADDASIELTGYLTDPTSYLEETAVFIVPLLAGGGMRVKILEAWARRLPVVSTAVGAEGIDVRHLSNLYLADDPVDFAAGVIELTRTPELAARLVRGGQETLGSTYDWRKAYVAWNHIYPCRSSISSPTLPA